MAPRPPTPALPPPPPTPNADWTVAEKAFFEKHGVTEEPEKEVIRKRALIHAYDRERQKFDKESNEPPPPEPTKKWYE